MVLVRHRDAPRSQTGCEPTRILGATARTTERTANTIGDTDYVNDTGSRRGEDLRPTGLASEQTPENLDHDTEGGKATDSTSRTGTCMAGASRGARRS